MAQKDTQLLLIIKHFNEPENEALASQLQTWREEDPQHEHYYQEVHRIWIASSNASVLEQIDVNAAVAKFSEKIGLPAGETTKIVRLHTGRNLLKWAIGFAAALVVGFFVYRQQHTIKVIEITKTTQASKDSLLLSDGSKVYLDAHSSLTYPEKFNETNRTVSFTSGNAFFKIATNDKRPFTITMDSTAVNVLGTSFNINRAEKRIDIDVKTGKIMFLANGIQQAILSAGTAASYDLEKDLITTFSSQNQNSDAWLTGELHFIDEPLSKVFDKLEDHYHVKIDLDTNLSSLGKLNATFVNNDLNEVITLLENTYPIIIQQKGNRLIIKKR